MQAATVLVVDDEVLVRFATADTLRDAGYEVAEASSGTEAKKLLKEGLKPNILVTDQLMPDVKGSDLAHELTSANPNMAVLIATGYADLPDVPYPLISKPFTSAQLIESVRKLVESNAGYP